MKIEGINITDEHIGKDVTYHSSDNTFDTGSITSYNDTYIFVKYKSTNTSQATKPQCLYWNDRLVEFCIKQSIIDMLEFEDILTIDNFKFEEGIRNSSTFNVYLHRNDKIFVKLKCFKIDGLYQIVNILDGEKKKLRRKLQIDELI